MIVLDVNAALAMMRETDEGVALKALLLENETVAAPNIFFSELGNSLWKYVRAGQLERTDLRGVLSSGIGLVDEFCADESLLVEALSEAICLNHPVCDMLYLVLARRKDATLFTLDKRLQKLCLEKGVNCVALGDGV